MAGSQAVSAGGEDAAALGQVRAQVGRELERFLRRQRRVVLGAAPELGPGLEAIGDLLGSGKRLRAAFCYWGFRGAGGVAGAGADGGADGVADGGADGGGCAGPGIFTAAAALELLHASALVHDDVMDGSDTRRGQPSMHRRFAARHSAAGWRGPAETFGLGAAILMGDLLLGWTEEMFRGSDLPAEALRDGAAVLSQMRTEVMAGQYLDLLEQARATGTVEAALRVARLKTARYTIERPLHLGAALAGTGHAGPGGTPGARLLPADRHAAPDPGITAGAHPAGDRAAGIYAAYSRYGLPLGTAFQLRDDLLGVFGDPALTGKPAGDDLREGKRTVLVAIALAKAGPAAAAVLNRGLGDPLLDAEAVNDVRAVITDVGALAECEALIDRYTSEALAALEDAPVTGEARAALAGLAAAATERIG